MSQKRIPASRSLKFALSTAAMGLTQVKKKGLRDMGATLSSDAAHRGDRSAVGDELGLQITDRQEDLRFPDRGLV